MKKLCLLLALLWSVTALGQTKVGLAQQATAPGTSGQLLYNNGGAVGAEDPIVSLNYVNLFNAVAATAQAVSSAVRIPNFGTQGNFYVTYASITGSPSACTLKPQWGDEFGNFATQNSTQSTTPSNGTTTFPWPGSISTFSNQNTTGAQIEVTFHCTTYPSTGTITMDFVPAQSVYIGNSTGTPISTNLSSIGSSSVVTAATGVQTVGIVGGSAGASLETTSGVLDQNIKNIGNAAYALGSTTSASSAPIVQATDQGNPCFNPNASVSSIAGATSGTSLTQIIALVSGKKIFICSFTFTSVSGTTPTYGLEYGTGANCAGGTTVLVGAPSATFAAGTVVSFPNAFIVPASNALCYKSGGTTPVMNYAAIYVQQ